MLAHTIKAFIYLSLFGIFLKPAFAETKSGSVDLKGATFSHPTPEIKLGSKVDAACSFSVAEYGGQQHLIAFVKLHNTASVAMYYSFNVAFFDKDKNLIGCVSQASENVSIGPDKKTQLGSCNVSLPNDQLAKVVSYQITYYESDELIGKAAK